jgi:coiled-coil and C2 domain-containing protein 1
MVSDAISGTLSSAVSREDIARIFNAPVQAHSVEEAQQRMEKYQETFEKAKAEGNSSKARRLGRIVKQYENAMKAHRRGNDFDLDSLPTPPGFPPIPMGDHSINQILNSEPRRVKARAPDPPAVVFQDKLPPAAAVSHQRPTTTVTNYRPKTELNARVDDLLSKQRQLKEAAVNSHNEGDKTSALKYLRLAKGFDPVIEAVKSGLPVDESSIPQLPMELLISNLNLE